MIGGGGGKPIGGGLGPPGPYGSYGPARYYRRSTRSTAHGAWCRYTGAPLPRVSLRNPRSGVWVLLIALLVRASLRVVPGTWPLTVYKHLTLSLVYKYYSFPSPIGLHYFFLCVLGQYRLLAWVLRQRERYRLVAIRVGQTETHICTYSAGNRTYTVNRIIKICFDIIEGEAKIVNLVSEIYSAWNHTCKSNNYNFFWYYWNGGEENQMFIISEKQMFGSRDFPTL